MKKRLLLLFSAMCFLMLLCPLKDTAVKAQAASQSVSAVKKLKITKQPSSVSGYNGDTLKVSFKASGEGLKYTWYYKDSGKSSYTKTTTFKGNAYKTVINSSRNGRKLICKVTDKYGNVVKTKAVTLTMRKTPKITKQPSSVSGYNGDTLKVSFKATGEGLKYTWYYKDSGKSSYTKTTTFKGNAYKTVINSSRNGRKLICKVTDKYGKSIKTKAVTLTMRKTPKITKQPTSISGYNGDTLKLSFKASGDGLKYTWYYKDFGKDSFLKTDSFKGNSYTIQMNEARHARQVYCKVTDKYGKVLKTNTVTLKMKVKSPKITCKDCLKESGGMTFDTSRICTQSEKLPKMPLTFESVFQINKNDLDKKMRPLDRYQEVKETVLFSSDDTYETAMCFSVTEKGNPKLNLRPTDWYCRFYNVTFDKVNVFSDKPVHLAITIDLKKATVKCYLNGVLKQTISNLTKKARATVNPSWSFAVGGDLYGGNPNYFRGEIYSLSVFSNIRSAAQINIDATSNVNLADKELMAHYNLALCDSCAQKDWSANKNNLKWEKLWQTTDEVKIPEEFDYSFAVIGDTQELSEDDPQVFSDLYEWLVKNKETHKISYVLGLGDITQKSYAHEWEHARTQIYKLNDEIPYLLSRGNHDYNTVENGIITAGFNTTFNDGVYNNQLTGTMAPDDVTNAYRTINICGIDYLFLTLDFGPNAEMLAWADSVVSAHPEHRVVVITHGYLYRDGTTLDANDAYSASKYPIKDRKAEQEAAPSLDGDDMWEQFASKHENVQLVLSGHDPCQHVVYRQDEGEKGNKVTQMLIDPQGIDGFYAPTGMVAMFYFSDNGNRLTVRYYSVAKDMYGSESSQFTIDL